ncbi:hypothetical protein NSQ24_03525 [Brevibacillus sp. FSL L8-0520]
MAAKWQTEWWAECWAEGGQKVGRMAVWNPLSLFWTAILSFLTGTLIWQ